MTSLVTVPELAIWARTDIADDDPFANVVLEASSLIVREAASQPDWTADTAPPRAKLICVLLAKRTYLNPDAVIREGAIGPVGGDAYIEDFARTLELTPAEAAELADMAPVPGEVQSDLWVMRTTRTRSDSVPATIFVPDDSGSDWWLPYLDINDIGAMSPEVA